MFKVHMVIYVSHWSFSKMNFGNSAEFAEYVEIFSRKITVFEPLV